MTAGGQAVEAAIATYVYGVGPAGAFADDEALAGVTGVGPGDPAVRLVRVGDLVALVSDSALPRHNVSRRNLLAHQRVLEEAMRRATVLPVSFGAVASGDLEVAEALLRREEDALHELLDRVAGRVELGVTLLWERERLFEEIVAERRDIQRLRDALAGLGPDTAYYERVELGQRVERAIFEKSERERQRALDALAPLAVETRVNENASDMMVMRAAFLVERAREEEFDAAVGALGEAERERLIVKYVGPLPPYSFVQLSVDWTG